MARGPARAQTKAKKKKKKGTQDKESKDDEIRGRKSSRKQVITFDESEEY